MKKARVLASIMVLSTPLSLRAETGNVQIYGTLNVDYEGVEPTGASPAAAHPANQLGATPTGVDVPHRDRVTSNSSNIAVRHAQPLAGGLKVFFQVESAIGWDNQAPFGANTPNGSPLAGRV